MRRKSPYLPLFIVILPGVVALAAVIIPDNYSRLRHDLDIALVVAEGNNYDNGSSLPDVYRKLQNSTNPFNSGTTINFNLVEPMEVKITIYDLLGREIQTLIDNFRQAGAHTVYFDSADLCSGIYYYRLYVGDVVETKRMALLK